MRDVLDLVLITATLLAFVVLTLLVALLDRPERDGS